MNGRDPSGEIKRYAKTRDAMSEAVAGNPHLKRGESRNRWPALRRRRTRRA